MRSLKEMLEEKKCFKLVCGAGNQNLNQVEKLVAIYAKAGCRFFDLSADEKVLQAAKKGLLAIPEKERENCHFCISIGTKNDIHVQIAEINKKTCRKCGECVSVCPQNAINDKFEIVEENCIGCRACLKACPTASIDFKSNQLSDLKSFLTSVKNGISCIELHASDVEDNEADEIWDYLCKNFDGMLSLCVDRLNLSNEKLLSRVKRLVSKRKPYTTIIQADGAPMSGNCDDYKTTLQAVATAELIQNENLPVYLMLSGGTNFKTAELANLCGINFNGIAVGSFARKIVKEYVKTENLSDNAAIFEEASKIAAKLVNM